jgi:hypothetical protein
MTTEAQAKLMRNVKTNLIRVREDFKRQNGPGSKIDEQEWMSNHILLDADLTAALYPHGPRVENAFEITKAIRDLGEKRLSASISIDANMHSCIPASL